MSGRPHLSSCRSRVTRSGWQLADLLLRGATVITDAVPPRYRFGVWARLVNVLAFGTELPRVEHRSTEQLAQPRPARRHPEPAPDVLRCLLIAGDLDTGGIETVVATLATGLADHGLEVEVACSSAGRAASVLREAGVRVSVVRSAEMAEFVRSMQPDVIELHRLDPDVISAIAPYLRKTVPVFHAMESYLDQSAWHSIDGLMAESPISIAVSESARQFFAPRYPENAIEIVVNGVGPVEAGSAGDIGAARARIESALGVSFSAGDKLVVGLQRFSDQKNARGLVDAFLLASETDDRLRLVIAGATNSWLEVRRADAVRRAHRNGNRVHFLGDSDAGVVLQAGDLFALDSFAEGGPIAAVEAAARGLPVVLSDVGFARELIGASDAGGVLVPRATATPSSRALARARRRRRQANREAFADGILAAVRYPRTIGGVPALFEEKTMIAGHARVLRSVAQPAAEHEKTRRGE